MRTLYGPLFFFGFISAALILAEYGASPGWLLPLLLLAIGISALCERCWPYRPA